LTPPRNTTCLAHKKGPWSFSRGPMHHRRTVGLDIPCQVARLQSLTPLLQAPGVEPAPHARRKTSGSKSRCNLGSGRKRPTRPPHARTRWCRGKDAPEESKKDSGVPVENTLDFFLLIGGPLASRSPRMAPGVELTSKRVPPEPNEAVSSGARQPAAP